MGTKAATICPARPTSMATENPAETSYRSRTYPWKAARSTAETASPRLNRTADAGWVPR